MSHLGINPVSGGRPPNERRTRGISAVRAGVFVEEEAIALIVAELVNLNARNVEDVIMKYVSRARSVREGINCRIRAIHPRCAIEE